MYSALPAPASTPPFGPQRSITCPAGAVDIRPGSSIRVEDAILALVTKSANDVAVVLAEGVGGSEAHFAQLMTTRARQLGMTRM